MNPLWPRQPTGEPHLGVGTHGPAAEGTVGVQVEPGVRSLFVCEAGVPETLTAGIEHAHHAATCLPPHGLRIPAKPISRSDRSRSPVPIWRSGRSEATLGGVYFAGFLPRVKASVFRRESPVSVSRWAVWTRRSQIASATVSSPMTACQSAGAS